MTQLLLIGRIAGERVAIAAEHVEAVVEIETIIPVPKAADHVAGLAALRSRVLTVVDPVAALELGAPAKEGRDAIVVPVDGHSYALLMETVEDVIEFDARIEPVRASLASGWRRVARGMVEVEGALLLLVDPHALIGGPALQAA